MQIKAVFLAALILAGAVAPALVSAAVATQGTDTEFQSSTSLIPAKTIQYSHTVTSGCDVLVVTAGFTANHGVSGTPTWNGNNLTLVDLADSSSSGADIAQAIYAVVTPAAATGNVSIVFANEANMTLSTAMCFSGIDTASVAAATNVIVPAVTNNAASSSTVFGSGGSAGNGLLVIATAAGDDMTPTSNSQSWTELHEFVTDGGAGGSSDGTHYIAFDAGGGPAGVTVNWNASDENAGSYIELVAAAATGAAPQRRRRQ